MADAPAMNEKSYILQNTTAPNQNPTSVPQTPVSVDDVRQLVPMETEEVNKDEITSLPYTSFNYINSIIGSGVIGMPFALLQSGFGLGIILMIVVAIVTDYSLVLMVKGGKIAQTNSYQGLVEAAFGRPGFYILSFMQFAYPFIAMISYNVIIADTTTKVLLRIFKLPATSILGNRHFIVILSTLLVTLPLSLYKKMSKLAKISFVSLLFIAFIMVAILIRWGTLAPSVPTSPNAWQFANTGVLQSIGIMSFALMCHHNTFLIYGSLENPTQDRWNKVTHASVFVSAILLLVFGIGGYATFTGLTQGDVLENYCMNDDLMTVARFFFGVTIMLTYPIECFVAREVIQNIVYVYQKNQPMLHHLLVTIVIVLLTVVASMSTACLGIVLELNGVLAAVPLAYAMPTLCYMKLEQGSVFSRQKLPALLTAVFGIVVAVAGLVMIIYNFNEHSQCSHGQQMSYCSPVNATVNKLRISSSLLPETTVVPETTTWFNMITNTPPQSIS